MCASSYLTVFTGNLSRRRRSGTKIGSQMEKNYSESIKPKHNLARHMCGMMHKLTGEVQGELGGLNYGKGEYAH